METRHREAPKDLPLPSRCAGNAHPNAFTLVELLVVIAILALLVSILLPSLYQAKEHALSAICQSNLHHLGQGLGGDDIGLPAPGAWLGAAGRMGTQENLFCPKHEPEESDGDFSDVYIVQRPGWFFSSIQDLLDGKQVVDNQVLLNPPGIAGDHGWNPEDPGPNEALICIDDDGACMITLSGPAKIRSIDPPGDGGLCGSDHWVVKGPGDGAWIRETITMLESDSADERLLMRLTGQGYADKLDPDVEIGGPPTSYGMNDLVAPHGARSEQILLIEYNRSVAYWGGTGNVIDDMYERVAARHLGKANLVNVDGSVVGMIPDDIQDKVRETEPMWRNN